jgi:peptidylprolyl isomerase
MAQAKTGDKVKVHYTGRLDDGTVFDSSDNRPPLEFTIGNGEIIPGFEKAVIGMEIGESKSTKIISDQAYGEHRQELVGEVKRNMVPDSLKPEVGQRLEMARPDGQTIPVIITAMTDEAITIDANHPLAGKDLTFEIKLMEIH